MIPKLIHFYWIGPHEPVQSFRDWARQNPGWTVRVWNDQQVLEEFKDSRNIQDIYVHTRKANQKSDVARLEILYRYGGVYVDADILALTSLEAAIPALHSQSCLLVQEKKRLLSNSFMACTPRHPVIDIYRSAIVADFEKPVWKATGPGRLTEVLLQENVIAVDPSVYEFCFRSAHPRLRILPHCLINLGADFRHDFWETDEASFLSQVRQQQRNRDFRYFQRCGLDSSHHILGWQIFLGGKAQRYEQFNTMDLDSLKRKARGYISVLTELVNKDAE